jgi:hypothetical protein
VSVLDSSEFPSREFAKLIQDPLQLDTRNRRQRCLLGGTELMAVIGGSTDPIVQQGLAEVGVSRGGGE